MMPLSAPLRHWTDRLRDRTFCAPSQFDSGVYGVRGEPIFARPFRQAHCAPIQGQASIPRHISVLLLVGGPSAVTRLVVAVVIDAVKCVSRWALAHVREEHIESVPLTAYTNASSSVAIKSLIARVAASVAHVCPDRVFTSVCGCSLWSLASAAVVVVANQVYSARFNDCAAGAFTLPHDVGSESLYGWLDHSQEAECAPSQVVSSWIKYSLVSHAVSFLGGEVSVRGGGSLDAARCLAFNYPTLQSAACL